MYARTLEELRGTTAEAIHWGGKVRSLDLLVEDDGMGFTLSDVRAAAGTEKILCYEHHWVANYVVSGKGDVEDLSSGDIWALDPGAVYTVGPKDRHRFRVDDDLHLVSIFNPPLAGQDAYGGDGTPAPADEGPGGPGRMFVKRLDNLRAAGREIIVARGTTRSTRILLQEDKVGFTVCDVHLARGNSNRLWYKNHWEANYILGGTGRVSDLTTGERWDLEPGVIYIVGPSDRHAMEAFSDLHLISVFNPPLRGDEQHDEEGTLPPSGPLPPGRAP